MNTKKDLKRLLKILNALVIKYHDHKYFLVKKNQIIELEKALLEINNSKGPEYD